MLRHISGLLLFLLPASATPSLHCLDDSDCHPGQFCHFSLGSTFCLDCRNCHADFQRHRARTESGCARNGWECGACLRGYAEQRLHGDGGRVAELCVSDPGGLEPTRPQTFSCSTNNGFGPCDVVCVAGIFLVAVAVLLVALQLKIVNNRYRARRRSRSSTRTQSDNSDDTDDAANRHQLGQGSFRPGGNNYGPGADNYGPQADNYGPGADNYGPRAENYGPGADNYGPGADNYGPGADNCRPDVDNYRYFLRFFFNNSRVPPFPPPPYNGPRTMAASNHPRRQRKPL